MISVSFAPLASLAPVLSNARVVIAVLCPLKLMTRVSILESHIRIVPSS